MARRWTLEEEILLRKKLIKLYVDKNLPIGEVAKILQLADSTIYDRLVRLGIPTLRSKKVRFNNVRLDIVIPRRYSSDLAEFIGIMLGDGHLTPMQVSVTLGNKEKSYVDYVSTLIKKIFHAKPKCIKSKKGHFIVYIGSTKIVRWLCDMGLVYNKVKYQVDIPRWIFRRSVFMKSALRGLYDTDGSVYRLKIGMQISFCNHSRPLIESVRRILLDLGFSPSKISGFNLYLTRFNDRVRFYNEIGFRNKKHIDKYLDFQGVSHSGNCSAL